MDWGAWWAAVHGVAKTWTRLSDFTFSFHYHALEKEMATHSSVLAWRIPGTGEPGGLPSMGLHRVGHDWCDSAAAAAARSQRRRPFMFILTLIHFTWRWGVWEISPDHYLWLSLGIELTLYTNVLSDLFFFFLRATKRKAFIVFWNLPPFNPPCPWSIPSLIKNSSNNWRLLRTPYWMRTI